VNPAWSPNGNLIAFDSVRNGDFDVWVVDATNPSDIRNVSNHPGYDGQPSWSPDGSQVLFVSSRSGADELWSAPVPPPAGAPADGSARSAATQITNTPAIDESQPDWGPVAFNTRPDALIKSPAMSAYRGNGVYSINGASQTVTTTADPGETRIFRIRAENDAAVRDTLTLAGPCSSRRLDLKYFAAGSEITRRVCAGTYSTGRLAHGQGTPITLRITATGSATVGRALVTATSRKNPMREDSVRARVVIGSVGAAPE
jgi:dipeptidyl aminopeptidase/acylaminoacyl peptidase